MPARPRLGARVLGSPALAGRTDLVLPRDEHLAYPERAIQFGTGAFLRGFVEYFLDRANHRGMFSGRIVLVGSTGSGRDQAFTDQEGLYTLISSGIEDGTTTESIRIVGVVSRAVSAADDWEAVLAVARTPALELIFSNTTEVGIVLDERDTPEMAPPRSFPGKLARFLVERGRAFDYDAARGVAVVPCELIDDNGARLRETVVAHARRWAIEPGFFRWLDAAVPFCNTLVDRIVPGAPSGAVRERLLGRLGYEDELLTACEPYRLFAIEAPGPARRLLRFTDADPGIVVADDIAPYRERKVRLLNGAHTLMVPVALGMGAVTVREAVEDPAVGAFVRTAMKDEIAPWLDAPGADRFADEVLDRFANPAVHHLLADITLQATMKMRVRLVPSIVRYAGATGRPPQALALGFAAHLWFAGGATAGAPQTGRVDDQVEPLRRLWEAHGDASELPAAMQRIARAACADAVLWGYDLTRVSGFCDAVAGHLTTIMAEGMPAALAGIAPALR